MNSLDPLWKMRKWVLVLLVVEKVIFLLLLLFAVIRVESRRCMSMVVTCGNVVGVELNFVVESMKSLLGEW